MRTNIGKVYLCFKELTIYADINRCYNRVVNKISREHRKRTTEKEGKLEISE